MSRETTQTQQKPSTSHPLIRGGILQRKCVSCGQHGIAQGECQSCKKMGLQRKLTIGASNDPLEREADRIADQVMAAPIHSEVGGTPPRIQRFTGQTDGQANMTAPASVDRVLSSPGKPLEPGLQQDMGQRFGHDFSQVRVYTDTAAERSARDVDANAYTVGHNIVFGAGRFAPETHEGRRLIAHELTHVVQQTGLDGIRVGQSNGTRGLFPSSRAAQATVSSRQPVTVNGTTRAYLARAPLTTAAGSGAVAQTRAQEIQRIFRPELSLGEVMGIIESIRPSESASGLYTLVRGREVLTITQDEYNKIRASAQKTLLDGLRKVRTKTEDAQLQYDAQHKIDEDQWIVSGAVRFFGGIDDPGGSIRQNVLFATYYAAAAQAFIERGQLVRGAEFFAKSEIFATTAKKTSQAYVDNLISTAETTVTVLEVTAVTAAATVVVIGAILAAPAVIAAAQAAPLVVALGTGAVSTAPVVAVEAAAVAVPATAAAVAVPATAAAVAVPAAAAAVAVPAAAAAVAVPATAAASTLSTAALATAGLAVASTTLSSDSPKPVAAEKEGGKRKKPAPTNTMRFQVQWGTGQGGPTFALPAVAPANPGVTTAQAVATLWATVWQVTPAAARTAAEPAAVAQQAWILNRPPNGIGPGVIKRSEYFPYLRYRDARVDVENLRGQNLKM